VRDRGCGGGGGGGFYAQSTKIENTQCVPRMMMVVV
jgi:hypothetical protein